MWSHHNTDLERRSPGGGRVICRESIPSRCIRSSGRALSPRLVNPASLICDMNRWSSGMLLHTVVVCSISSGGDHVVQYCLDAIRSK